MIALLLAFALIGLVGWFVFTPIPERRPPERGDLWRSEAGALIRVVAVADGRVTLEIQDLYQSDLWGRSSVTEDEWAWATEEWTWEGADPDLLIPPPADGGAA